jgi:hypothetical protein
VLFTCLSDVAPHSPEETPPTAGHAVAGPGSSHVVLGSSASLCSAHTLSCQNGQVGMQAPHLFPENWIVAADAVDACRTSSHL